MTKEKITLEEKKALSLYTNNCIGIANQIKYYLENGNSWHSEYKPLSEMGLEKFVKCLINGYELELPPSPQYKTDKIDVSFNHYEKENIHNIMYIGLLHNEKLQVNKTFSIDEATKIKDTLDELISYYYEYVN